MAKIQQKQITGGGTNNGNTSNSNLFMEVIAIVDDQSTLGPLSNTPSGAMFMLIVNGVVYTSIGVDPPFTISTTSLLWSTVNAGFELMSTDSVVAIYTI